MTYFAVIDTNVLVSSLLKPDSIPGFIVKEALTGSIIPLLHDTILEEYREVLGRKKFCFDRRDIRLILENLCNRSVFIDAEPVSDLVSDPNDAIFYAVTIEKRMTDDAYLITGNKKHFPVQPFIVTPKEMLEILMMY